MRVPHWLAWGARPRFEEYWPSKRPLRMWPSPTSYPRQASPVAAAQAYGLWAELGEGAVDFRAVFEQLGRVGCEGWAIVEIDRTTKPTPRDSITACYAHLARLGLVSTN